MRGQKYSKALTWRQSLRRCLGRSRLCRDRAGASAVEFALVSPILILIIAGIIDAGALFYLQSNMVTAARETARRLSVGSLTNQSDGEAFASSLIVNWDATFTINVTEPNDTDYLVEISVPIDDAALVDPLNIFSRGTLRAQAVMARE